MIWSIYWLGLVAFLVVIITAIVRTFHSSIDYYVKASEVEKIESAHLRRAAQ